MRTRQPFGVLALGLAAVLGTLGSGGRCPADTLYGATAGSNGGGVLVTLNPATGAVVTNVGPLADSSGGLYGITGLAFQSSSGPLYGVTSLNSPTDPVWLVTVNPLTARVTPVGPLNTTNHDPLGDIAFDPTSGTLYGANAVGGALYRVNLTTGAATRISPNNDPITTGSAGHGFAIDAAGDLFTTPDGATGNLYGYNKTTGVATLLTGLSGAPLPDANINALAFDNATLFGANAGNFGSGPAELITLNTTTGAITDVGPSIDNLDALAFQPAAPPVPEPSTLALLALGTGALAGWRRWRVRAAG